MCNCARYLGKKQIYATAKKNMHVKVTKQFGLERTKSYNFCKIEVVEVSKKENSRYCEEKKWQ